MIRGRYKPGGPRVQRADAARNIAACRCRPAGRAAAAAAHAFASAAATASLSAVQPTMPPWAWIISMAAALKLGK